MSNGFGSGDSTGIEAPTPDPEGAAPAPQLPPHVAVVTLGPQDAARLPANPEEDGVLGPRTLPRRRSDFRLGRAAARLALAQLGADTPSILRGAHREPLWPRNVAGSITHAAGWALAAVAWRDGCGGIGVDLEHKGRSFAELKRHTAFNEELAWIESLPPSEQLAAALEVFSAKESIYKAFFPRVGRYFGFTSAEVSPGATRGSLDGRLLELIDPAYPTDRTFPIQVDWFGDLLLTSLVLPPDN